MADQLVLSYWLRGYNERTMLGHFEKLLRRFPFSAACPGISSLRVYALEEAEPPLMETPFDPGADVETAIFAAAEFRNADCGYLAGGFWDLWQFQEARRERGEDPVQHPGPSAAGARTGPGPFRRETQLMD